jgi:protein phosphatase
VPVKIFGNIYGQYGDLMRFFDSWGLPDNQGKDQDKEAIDYAFLGNYVGQVKNSLEVILLLFALKLRFPNQIHLLRGSHEDEKVNTTSGFGEECQFRLQEDIRDPNSVFQKINSLFEYYPLAAVLEEKVLCVHSGIGTTVRSYEEFLVPKP